MSDSFNEKYFSRAGREPWAPRRFQLPCPKCQAMTRVTENTNVFVGDCLTCGESVEIEAADLGPRAMA